MHFAWPSLDQAVRHTQSMFLFKYTQNLKTHWFYGWLSWISIHSVLLLPSDKSEMPHDLIFNRKALPVFDKFRTFPFGSLIIITFFVHFHRFPRVRVIFIPKNWISISAFLNIWNQNKKLNVLYRNQIAKH